MRKERESFKLVRRIKADKSGRNITSYERQDVRDARPVYHHPLHHKDWRRVDSQRLYLTVKQADRYFPLLGENIVLVSPTGSIDKDQPIRNWAVGRNRYQRDSVDNFWEYLGYSPAVKWSTIYTILHEDFLRNNMYKKYGEDLKSMALDLLELGHFNEFLQEIRIRSTAELIQSDNHDLTQQVYMPHMLLHWDDQSLLNGRYAPNNMLKMFNKLTRQQHYMTSDRAEDMLSDWFYRLVSFKLPGLWVNTELPSFLEEEHLMSILPRGEMRLGRHFSLNLNMTALKSMYSLSRDYDQYLNEMEMWRMFRVTEHSFDNLYEKVLSDYNDSLVNPDLEYNSISYYLFKQLPRVFAYKMWKVYNLPLSEEIFHLLELYQHEERSNTLHFVELGINHNKAPFLELRDSRHTTIKHFDTELADYLLQQQLLSEHILDQDTKNMWKDIVNDKDRHINVEAVEKLANKICQRKTSGIRSVVVDMRPELLPENKWWNDDWITVHERGWIREVDSTPFWTLQYEWNGDGMKLVNPNLEVTSKEEYKRIYRDKPDFRFSNASHRYRYPDVFLRNSYKLFNDIDEEHKQVYHNLMKLSTFKHKNMIRRSRTGDLSAAYRYLLNSWIRIPLMTEELDLIQEPMWRFKATHSNRFWMLRKDYHRNLLIEPDSPNEILNIIPITPTIGGVEDPWIYKIFLNQEHLLYDRKLLNQFPLWLLPSQIFPHIRELQQSSFQLQHLGVRQNYEVHFHHVLDNGFIQGPLRIGVEQFETDEHLLLDGIYIGNWEDKQKKTFHQFQVREQSKHVFEWSMLIRDLYAQQVTISVGTQVTVYPLENKTYRIRSLGLENMYSLILLNSNNLHLIRPLLGVEMVLQQAWGAYKYWNNDVFAKRNLFNTFLLELLSVAYQEVPFIPKPKHAIIDDTEFLDRFEQYSLDLSRQDRSDLQEIARLAKQGLTIRDDKGYLSEAHRREIEALKKQVKPTLKLSDYVDLRWELLDLAKSVIPYIKIDWALYLSHDYLLRVMSRNKNSFIPALITLVTVQTNQLQERSGIPILGLSCMVGAIGLQVFSNTLRIETQHYDKLMGNFIESPSKGMVNMFQIRFLGSMGKGSTPQIMLEKLVQNHFLTRGITSVRDNFNALNRWYKSLGESKVDK